MTSRASLINRQVLLVDDDGDFCASIQELLALHGYTVYVARDCESALVVAKQHELHVVLLDIRVGNDNGITLIGQLREMHPRLLCVIVTGYPNIDNAIHAVREQAYDYLRKPIGGAMLLAALGRCFDHLELRRQKDVLEEQLSKMQKLEAVGQLAASLSHDLNNTFTAILGNLEVTAAELQGQSVSAQALSCLGAIGRSTQQAATLTSRVLAFARHRPERRETVHLGRLLPELADTLRHMVTTRVDLELDVRPDVPPVNVDLVELEQVLLNLGINARDAMPNGGSLRLVARLASLDGDSEPVRQGALSAGRFAVLSVRDTGCGMDTEVLSQIFEPFFTTKPVGRGTGLGLFSVRDIVRRSGGHIEVNSQVGKGSEFVVYLPAVSGVVSPPAAPAVEVDELSGTETVLVCDDRDEVRGSLARVLGCSGYTVLAVGDGPGALALAHEHRDDLAAVLTDVMLPGMDGRTLVESLRQEHPDLRVIYSSGYPADALALNLDGDARAVFLEKPCAPNVLRRVLRHLLDSRVPRA
ncbi:MAG: response regulator [Phycisphaerae bacterium]|nr:response regulator [Phycisphaerae bacterium]